MARCTIAAARIHPANVPYRDKSVVEAHFQPGANLAAYLDAMQSNDDGLDHEVIADLTEISRDTGEDLIAVLLKMFFADLPDTLGAICEVARAGNFSELARAAHRIKGTSAALGARRFAGICAALESIGERATAPDALEDLLAALAAEANRLREVLPRALGGAEAG
jgi:HPt (histidine-containing phosphotransfer) domain-containing protein